MFDDEKERVLGKLGKPDRSKKGGVDEQIQPLLDAINADPDYYTTSSCAGRIHLFVDPASGKKHEGEWLYVSHDPVDATTIKEHLAELPSETTWFRMEGAILHVCARDLDAANRFLAACKRSGWKHSGITSSEKRVMIEATTSESIAVPIANGELFVDERFIDYLVTEANAKLACVREKRDRLRRELQ